MINFAIIGCGSIAQRHAQLAAAGGKLLAVCDIEMEKACQLAKQYHARAYDNIDKLFENEKQVQVIVICTPNSLHASHTIKSLQAGFHVLCEKPMAIHVEDCVLMIDAARMHNKKLFIVKQNRFNPPVIALKKLLDEDRLGKIGSVQLNGFWNRDAGYYKSNWKGTREMDGGILYTQFSHFIDLMYWMIGDVKEVLAYGNNFFHHRTIEFEDTVSASIQFKNGAIGTLHCTINSYHKNMEGSLTIFGENGTIKVGGQYLNTIEYQEIRNIHIDDLPGGNKSNNYGSYEGSMSNHDKMYIHLHDVLERGAENQFAGEDALKTVEIIEKIYRAVRK